MPAARESMLDAACTALARRPWSAVRMVEVAEAAGVSRQTLYNEFGSKDGLARALVRREVDVYLAGVERALGGAEESRDGPAAAGDSRDSLGRADYVRDRHAGPSDLWDRLAAAAEWTVSAARDSALVRALLTGCWSAGLPVLGLKAVSSSAAAVPAQRRADGPLPSAGELVALVRDRAVALSTPPGGPRPDTAELARHCELAVRLALSCVVAPPAGGGVAELVRGALARLSA